jgi:hypothetical protein
MRRAHEHRSTLARWWPALALLSLAGAPGCGGADDGGAEDAGDVASFPSVRVIVAVGERTATNGCYFASDARSDARGCILHQLDLDPERGVVSDVRAVTSLGEGGAWQPSANAGLLAFSRRSDTGIQAVTVPLDALAPGAAATVVSPTSGLWVWPNLARDGVLRLSRSLPTGTGPSCLQPGDGTCVEIDRWNETIERVGGGMATVGGAAGFSLEDTWSHPTEPSVLAGHGKFRRVGTARPDCATSCMDMNSSPMPIILNSRTGVSQILDLVSDDPALGGGTRPLTGCAHLAWSPDGTRLLCTEQGTAALMSAGLQSRLYTLHYDVRGLVSGAPPLVTTTASPLFSHSTAATLFPLAAGQRCDIFYHKYAEWCGHADLVVATVGCGMETMPGAVDLLYGRVFAIDLRDPARPVYIDLTAGVERATGRAFNDLTSFTATCVPAR